MGTAVPPGGDNFTHPCMLHVCLMEVQPGATDTTTTLIGATGASTPSGRHGCRHERIPPMYDKAYAFSLQPDDWRTAGPSLPFKVWAVTAALHLGEEEVPHEAIARCTAKCRAAHGGCAAEVVHAMAPVVHASRGVSLGVSLTCMSDMWQAGWMCIATAKWRGQAER